MICYSQLARVQFQKASRFQELKITRTTLTTRTQTSLGKPNAIQSSNTHIFLIHPENQSSLFKLRDSNHQTPWIMLRLQPQRTACVHACARVWMQHGVGAYMTHICSCVNSCLYAYLSTTQSTDIYIYIYIYITTYIYIYIER